MDSEIKITNKEWIATQQEIQKNCDQFAFVKTALEEIKALMADQSKKFDDFKSYSRDESLRMKMEWDKKFSDKSDKDEKRFSSLEIWRGWLTGILAILSGAVGIFGVKIWEILSK